MNNADRRNMIITENPKNPQKISLTGTRGSEYVECLFNMGAVSDFINF